MSNETHHDRNIRSILDWLHTERVLGTQLVVVVEAAEKGGFCTIVKDETKQVVKEKRCAIPKIT